LLLLSGFLTGAQFPLASRLCGGDGSLAASRIYAFDLGGACLGGFVGGLLLLPLLGFRGTLLVLLLLKSGSFIMLQIAAIGGRLEK